MSLVQISEGPGTFVHAFPSSSADKVALYLHAGLDINGFAISPDEARSVAAGLLDVADEVEAAKRAAVEERTAANQEAIRDWAVNGNVGGLSEGLAELGYRIVSELPAVNGCNDGV